MSNAVHDLPALKWGDLVAPCSAIPTEFGHDQAPRVWPFVDAEGHQWMRRKPHKVRATLYFLNTIEAGSFPGKWAEWRKALLDGHARKLRHPDLGEFDARVETGSYTISAESPAGIVVEVSWIESKQTLDGPSSAFSTQPSDATAAAEQADAAMAQVDIAYPDGTGSTSLTEALLALASTIQTTPEFYEGQVNAILGAIDHIEDRFVASLTAAATLPQPEKDLIVNDPAGWVLYQSLYILREALNQQVDQNKKQARPTATAAVPSSTTCSALASLYGNTLDDIIALNPSFTAAPTVPKGSTVRYYTKS